MLVLRTARMVAAANLELDIQQVRPETQLAEKSGAILDELFSQVRELLQQEWALDPRGGLDGEPTIPSLAELDLSLEPNEPVDVASVAERATRAAVRLLLGHRLDVPADELRSELHFTMDLGADSLTRVDLVLLLEEALEVSVPDDSLALVQTVGDAELFSVLFDRTREEIILTLGEGAEALAYDTPLAEVGDPEGASAIAAAVKAVGNDLPSCEARCHTLKDAVRLAFLSDKVRVALASACEKGVETIKSDTIPERDLGITSEQVAIVLGELADALELDRVAVAESHKRTVAATIQALADASLEASAM